MLTLTQIKKDGDIMEAHVLMNDNGKTGFIRADVKTKEYLVREGRVQFRMALNGLLEVAKLNEIPEFFKVFWY